MWIKICGNTTLEDAQVASESSADAVGFVFAESPRRVTVDQARKIVPLLPAGLEKVGVFVDASLEEIVKVVLECGLTGIQLHSTPDAALVLRLRERLPEAPIGGRLSIFRVLHYSGDFDRQLAAIQDSAIDAVLVDSRTTQAVGGTGIAFDWQGARRSFSGGHPRLIAAGGLRPENVGEAIETLRPWGVDVSSGVEASPGKKDPQRVRAFIDIARRAMQPVKVNR